MEKLATIQRVKNVRKHTNADSLDLVDVLAWQVVVKRNEFAEGDLCIYIVTDSILPDKPNFEFLRNKNFRIKSIRLRGEPSSGICFPLGILKNMPNVPIDVILTEGSDVTDILGCVHYEKAVPAQLAGKIVGQRPSFISKTDELNLRSYPALVEAMKGLPYYISRKDDGSSGSYFLKDGVFGVCSRNLQLLEEENNGFWKMAKKYNIEAILRNRFTDNVCLQAECVGPGIQDNHLGLKEVELHAFSIIDLNTKRLVSLHDLKEFCGINNIPMVTIIEEEDVFEYELHELVSLANSQKYPNGSPAEGIVVRMQQYTYNTSERMAWCALSGKVMNENFKDKE